ncbi:DUF6503 family protein [Croceitalea rosinachiae]|uniref:DUF6503 family protein n=1 Tax=Croceitalea rosinachiae TaxID=3075596 RepID=A0ABU3A7X5_9FLAO|nr:DUF6503 family protein [Croceitalea sp. F388]MDT0606044.1 DUF6503 family protein [Croceitalea sp. F388]
MSRIICFISILFSLASNAQEISGVELLEKTIAYHDSNNQWGTFQGTFKVVMQTPNASERLSSIAIDLPRELFTLEVKKDDNSYAYVIDKDSCQISLNGEIDPSKEAIKEFRLTCERGNMFKNYYTYLYGLPMKLKDTGTQIDPKVLKKSFKGKDYLVLKATYDVEVGGDTWYFYFDPNTYAMEVYQFYHDEAKNDGEYILLKGMEEINGIKMPQTRAWYYNKDDKYLGTDILSKD